MNKVTRDLKFTWKGFTHGTGAWVFGLSVTIFLISMWGRAMVVDTDSLAESMSPLSGAVPVSQVFSGWLADEMVDAGVAPEVVDTSLESVLAAPQVASALDNLVTEVILAAGSASAGNATVDVARLFRPAVPAITNAITDAAGVPVTESQVATIIEGLDPLVVRGEGGRPMVGTASPMATRLGTAAVVALAAMAFAGWVTVLASQDRLVELRRLLHRVTLGALSFAVILRIGAWVLSPSGGRAPITDTMGALAGAKWLVPMTIAAVAGASSLLVRHYKRTRRVEESLVIDEPPTPPPGQTLSSTTQR